MENALLKRKKSAPKRRRTKVSIFSPKVINGVGRQYVFNFPLLSIMTKEDGQYMIVNDMLAMIAAGRTRAEAEQDFADLFDYIYRRYNELPDEQLSERIKRVKRILSNTVERIIVTP